ncbi:MAG: hypothetical protein INH41_00190 [Myxococcaceae bacterium]|jgi:hypothetical protein|nr:hypothetical protein [Myxococcaceae bacterium]MCA3010795.1 hypothetical protein [Myxococcaceae bacterium]
MAPQSPALALLRQLVERHHPHWLLDDVELRRGDDTVELWGALSRTMHFGSARVTLSTGLLVLVDEDHRDGGADEVGRVMLGAEALEALRACLA